MSSHDRAEPELRTNSVSHKFFGASHYALKKRLVIPRWWLEGLLLRCGRSFWNISVAHTSGAHSGAHSEILGIPQKTTGRLIVSYSRLWNALLRRFLNGEASGRSVSFALSELFRGTHAEQLEQFHELSQHLMSPLECVTRSALLGGEKLSDEGSAVARASGQRSPVVAARSSCVLVQRTRIEEQGSLVIDFLMDAETMLSGNFLSDAADPRFSKKGKGELHFFPQSQPQPHCFVTLNPSVLASQGSTTTAGRGRGRPTSSLKKLLLYLWIELRKASCGESGDGLVLCDELSSKQSREFCSELLGRGAQLYDLGVLGWADALPSHRVRDLRQRNEAALVGENVTSGGGVQLVSLSDHMNEVLEFERRVAARFLAQGASSSSFEPRPVAEKTALKGKTVPVSASGTRLKRLKALARRAQRCGTTWSEEHETPVGASTPPTVSSPLDGEMEYALKLAQYYESLNLRQRAQLDEEMRQRGPAAFRAFISPRLALSTRSDTTGSRSKLDS